MKKLLLTAALIVMLFGFGRLAIACDGYVVGCDDEPYNSGTKSGAATCNTLGCGW